MKRSFPLLCLVLLATVACKQVTPEEQIAKIGTYFSDHKNGYAAFLQQVDATKRSDYLTLVQAKDLGAAEVWLLDTDEGKTLVAEYPGSKPKKGTEPQIALVTASLDDPQACAAALAVVEAFKKMKLRHASTLRTAFYTPASDSATVSGLDVLRDDLVEANEAISYNLDLSTQRSQAPHTFLIEENLRFVSQFIEVLPPYFVPLGEYRFQQGVYPNHNWPINAATYRYRIDPQSISSETAALTTLVYLLN